jgi:hypothetical protein
MIMCIRLMILLALVFAFGIVCSDDNPVVQDDDEPPVGLANKVWVKSDTVTAGERIALEVYVENNEPLTGIVIPLGFTDTTIALDSVTFAGSRFEDLELTNAEIDFDEQYMTIYTYTSGAEVIDSGSGLMCCLHFWVFGYSPTQDIIIDSVNIPPALRMGFMDSNGTAYTPEFEAGILHISGFDR